MYPYSRAHVRGMAPLSRRRLDFGDKDKHATLTAKRDGQRPRETLAASNAPAAFGLAMLSLRRQGPNARNVRN